MIGNFGSEAPVNTRVQRLQKCRLMELDAAIDGGGTDRRLPVSYGSSPASYSGDLFRQSFMLFDVILSMKAIVSDHHDCSDYSLLRDVT